MTPAAYITSPDLYDRVYAGFVADIPFHVREARAAAGPALEVCCGTGRVLAPMREAGVAVEGLDFDEPMLEGCRRRLAERGLEARLHQGDMRDFTLPGRFAYLYVPFNSFLHNLTQDDQLATLRRCREHLRPGGQLTVTTYHPNARMLAEFDGTPRVWKELPEPGGRRLRITNAVRVDRVNQISDNDRTVEELDEGGRVVATHRYGFRLRYVYQPEMALLFRVAGFARWDAVSPCAAWDGAAYDPPRPPEDGGVIAHRAWNAA